MIPLAIISVFQRFAAWLKAHPAVRCALIALLAFIIGAGAGFFGKPAKVVTRDVVKTQTVEKVVTRDVVRTVAVAAVKRHKVATVKETKEPNGAVVIVRTVTTDTGVQEKTDTNANKNDTASASVATQEDHTHIVENQANWQVNALGGVVLSRPAAGGLSATPVVGAQVTRRIVGPLTVGGWVLVGTDGRSGAGGVSVGGTF